MNSRQSLADRRARLAIERALNIAGTCGRLREAARTSGSAARRTALREIAKKIERRRYLRLSVSWWLTKAEEMMR